MYTSFTISSVDREISSNHSGMTDAFRKRREYIQFFKYLTYAFLMPFFITVATGVAEHFQIIQFFMGSRNSYFDSEFYWMVGIAQLSNCARQWEARAHGHSPLCPSHRHNNVGTFACARPIIEITRAQSAVPA